MRVVLTEFKKLFGFDSLHVTLFREGDGYIYEREKIETSGKTESDTVMELPFSDLSVVQRFISSDPHQADVMTENAKLLRILTADMALHKENKS